MKNKKLWHNSFTHLIYILSVSDRVQTSQGVWIFKMGLNWVIFIQHFTTHESSMGSYLLLDTSVISKCWSNIPKSIIVTSHPYPSKIFHPLPTWVACIFSATDQTSIFVFILIFRGINLTYIIFVAYRCNTVLILSLFYLWKFLWLGYLMSPLTPSMATPLPFKKYRHAQNTKFRLFLLWSKP